MNDLAVAQHGDPLADLVEFFEPVAYVDDTHAVLSQLPDHPEEGLHFVRLERRGRLVHDDHPGLQRDRLNDRDHLLDPYTE